MTPRTIKKMFPAQPTLEGAGVRLQRGFGHNEVPQFDPFLLLDDFGSENPEDYLAGFPWHPHRGIETVTYIVRGDVAHKDNIGNAGVIKSGEVQWMTAGSGIIHEEMPQHYSGLSKGFQLWVNLPKKSKMSAPRYRGITQKEIPVVEKDGAMVKIIAGEFAGAKGPVTDTSVAVVYLDITLDAEKQFEYTIPKHYTTFLYVFEGSVVVGEESVGENVVALTNDGDMIQFGAKGNRARLLLIAGEPISEEIAWGGPIVMNTKEELEQAFEEYREGTFVKEEGKEF